MLHKVLKKLQNYDSKKVQELLNTDETFLVHKFLNCFSVLKQTFFCSKLLSSVILSRNFFSPSAWPPNRLLVLKCNFNGTDDLRHVLLFPIYSEFAFYYSMAVVRWSCCCGQQGRRYKVTGLAFFLDRRNIVGSSFCMELAARIWPAWLKTPAARSAACGYWKAFNLSEGKIIPAPFFHSMTICRQYGRKLFWTRKMHSMTIIYGPIVLKAAKKPFIFWLFSTCIFSAFWGQNIQCVCWLLSPV